MYVGMYVCMHVCMYVVCMTVYVCMYVCMYACTVQPPKADTLRSEHTRADNASVTDRKYHTINVTTSEKRLPLNSEQKTLISIPKQFLNVLLPPKSGHSGNHALTVQPHPHTLHIITSLESQSSK